MANWYVGSTKYTAVAQWAALTTYSVGNIVRQLASPTVGNERCFRASAITTGISGASEPAWTLTKGGTTSDTGVTWTEITGQAVFNGDGGGTAWAAPHARMANASASGWASAGDTVYVSNNHAATQSATLTINPTATINNPLNFICVVDTTVPPTATATTASETASSAALTVAGNNSGTGYFYGINFIVSGSSNTSLTVTSNYQGVTSFEKCTFNLSTTSSSAIINLGGGGANLATFTGCTFLFGNTGQSIALPNNGTQTTCRLIGCVFASSGSVPTTLFSAPFANSSIIILRDCDISAVTGSLVNISGASSTTYAFTNCKLGSGVSITAGSYQFPGGEAIRLETCDSGNTNYQFYAGNYMGTVKQETTIVRTGGASNGTTGISYNITTSANANLHVPFDTSFPGAEEISVWNTNASGAQTATIYLTSNTALTNATFWAEAEYLGTSSFPLGLNVSSKVALLASAAALTSDSSTWGGSISNKYNIVLNFTPTEVGVLKVRLYCAAASATVYVDPEVVISNQTSGRQYIIPGGTFHNDASSSGGSTSMVVHPGLVGGMHG